MYFKNFENKNQMTQSIRDNGILVLKNFLSKKNINEIKKKSENFLNKPNYLKVVPNEKKLSNIQKISKNLKKKNDLYWTSNKKDIVDDNLNLDIFKKKAKIKLNGKIIKKGFRYYGKFTNSIDVKDPLVNLLEINNIVFNKNLIRIASNFLKSEVFLGYALLRFHFNNNLPENDISYFHTDTRTKTTKSKNKLVKFTIPFHLKGHQKTEYNHILYSRKKMKPYSNKYER